jgi:uncharacterized protein YcfL
MLKKILIASLIILLITNIVTCNSNRKNNTVDFPEAVFDSLKTIVSINSYGDTIYIAQSKLIEAQTSELKKMAKLLKDQDYALYKLSQSIDKNTQNATYYNSVTNIYDSTINVTIVDSTKSFPKYESTLANKWYDAKLEMSKDSAKLNVTFNNPFVVSHKYVKSRLFKKDLVVEVKPENPYTKITELKSYKIPAKKHKFDLNSNINLYNKFAAIGLEANYRYNHFGARASVGYSNFGLIYGGGLTYTLMSNY